MFSFSFSTLQQQSLTTRLQPQRLLLLNTATSLVLRFALHMFALQLPPDPSNHPHSANLPLPLAISLHSLTKPLAYIRLLLALVVTELPCLYTWRCLFWWRLAATARRLVFPCRP